MIAPIALQAGTDEVAIPCQGVVLEGEYTSPTKTKALIIFAHGSGSSRHSPRNQAVARSFQERGLGTFLFDLLTRDEERLDCETRHLRFDIPLLAGRLIEVTRWLLRNLSQSDPPALGFFGASTGAAAALVAAAELGERIGAIVSRGGRPDLAEDALPRVLAPTLLLVGARDKPVIELNKEVRHYLRCKNVLRIVPGATHLFEEPGALDCVANLAGDWFLQHLASPPSRTSVMSNGDGGQLTQEATSHPAYLTGHGSP
jgi:putative phosphoribosyl transferase